MRTVIVAVISGLAGAVLYTALLAPGPSEPTSTVADADLLARVVRLEKDLAAREEEATARLEGKASAAEVRLTAQDARLASLESRLEDGESKLVALGEVVKEARAEARKEDERTPPARDARGEEARAKEVARWVARLQDPNENIRFSATLELGRLKDPRVAKELVAVLRADGDYYVRLGAATALGDIEAYDGVSALIEALDDQDTLVRTAASDALKKVTGHAIPFDAEMSAGDRKDVMGRWRDWWRDNEYRLRAR